MFIRQTRTNNKVTGEGYYTYRLVRGERLGGRVRQITLLNLGRHFAIRQDDWPVLCQRIEQLLPPQSAFLPTPCSAAIEKEAQRCVSQLIARAPGSGGGLSSSGTDILSSAMPVAVPATPQSPAASGAPASSAPTPPTPSSPDFQEVDLETLQLAQARSVGVEHVALHALSQLGLIDLFKTLGMNGVIRSALLGSLVGRMAHPASELSTWRWLQEQSALGELIDVDYQRLSLSSLYRASDALMAHREAIETHLFGRVQSLFRLEETVTLYDLTNTDFEGQAAENPKAAHGRSKEKRSDCPLLTLGLVLDGSGFIRRSRTFAGNVSEGRTLEAMLLGLDTPPGALVILDAGIASEANIAWLVAQGYRYLVVRRGGTRQFDEARALAIETARGDPLRLQKELSEDGQEVRLYCHSEGREAKERAMHQRFSQAFEDGLRKIAESLQKPRTEKRPDKLQERLGKLKARSHGVSQHYTITLETDEKGKKVTGIQWEKSLKEGSRATHPGVYCLRSNELDWDEEKLWRTYTLLTDLESVFRSLKRELGLRPVFHTKEDRSDGHLFITVLAYQCVQVLRKTLKEHGINERWARLRDILSVQRRVTASFQRRDGRFTHVRKATTPEPALKAIYQALGVSPLPGGTKKLIS